MINDYPALMFLALLALFSPLAALSSYMTVVGRFDRGDQLRLALGLFVNVAIFALSAVWVGEPLLKVLGISTAALSVTGGIALFYAGVPMMRGIEEVAPEQSSAAAASAEADGSVPTDTWRSVLFTPLSFPLTIGGTSFGLIVAFVSNGESVTDKIHFSVAGLAYALVASITLLAAGHVHRAASPRARMILVRVAGILLTAIAATLIASGGTGLVMDALANYRGG